MLNTGPGQVVQGLASYQEMCDVYLVYWVQVQTCPFISTDIYTSIIYIYISKVSVYLQGDHTQLLQGATSCTNPGPPTSWANMGFTNIPDTYG